MKKKLLAVVVFLFSMGWASAQTQLSLPDAVNFALQHKAEAQKARLDIKNAAYQIEEVRANALPQINASGGLTHNAILQQTALNMNGETMVIKMGQPWTSSAAVQLNQQIFNMSVFQGLKAAKSTKEFYAINASLTEEQIIEKVANSYYEVFKTKSQIETIDQTITNTSRVKDVIASLESNGLAKKIDLDRIIVSLNNLKSSRQQLRNGLMLQENALKYLIGMEIDTQIILAENTFDAPQTIYAKDAVNLDNRTEIQLMKKQGELLQLNMKATEARKYPTLSFNANYGYMGMGSRFPYFYGGNSNVNWSNYSSFGLTLNVPIFNGHAVRSKVRQAQVDIDRYNEDYKDMKLALNLAIENAYTQINNSYITLNVQESNKKLARQVLSNVENNYKNGLASLTDLLDAENSYADAQNNYTAAVLDYKLAEVQLVKAKGELKTFYTNK
ncbi:MAG: TolC family protein [Niabella sp.]